MAGNILLVYPNIARAERYRGRLGVFGGRQIPSGIFYLAAYLRRRGLRVHALDAEAQNLGDADVVACARAERYGVVGISMTTALYRRGTELACALKAQLPDVTVIAGGPHVSGQPLETLDCAAFDYAIPREGEETLCETLRMIECGSPAGSVAGLVYRRDGVAVAAPPRPLIADLDSLPLPAYDLIPDMNVYCPPPFNYRQRPVANIVTSRGCPNECTFCAHATFGRRLRLRSAAGVAAEIELLIRRFGVREIFFSDDCFTIDPGRVRRIFALTAQRGLHFPWSCRSRVDLVDEPLLRFMRARGCWHIAFGIESGDEGILRTIRKHVTREQVERAVTLAHSAGIVTKGFFIVGHPGESPSTIETTISFAERLQLDQIAVILNTPLPGTWQYEHADECGSIDRTSWTNYTFWRPVFVPPGFTADLLVRRHSEFLRRFYVRPKWLLRQLWHAVRYPRLAAQAARLVAGLLAAAVRDRRRSAVAA